MEISTTGLILQDQAIAETDKLLTILSESEGVIRAFSKIGKNFRGRAQNIAASLSPLVFSRFVIYKGRDKYIIRHSSPVKIFFELRKDLEKLSLAQYFCEIATSFKLEAADSNKILKLILNSLHLLCLAKDRSTLLKIKSVVELKICATLGFMPDLVCCNKCKKYTNKTMFFLIDQALLQCGDCYDQQDHTALELCPGSLAALRHILYADDAKIFNFKIGPNAAKNLSLATENYIKYINEKPFKALNFYKSIRKI